MNDRPEIEYTDELIEYYHEFPSYYEIVHNTHNGKELMLALPEFIDEILSVIEHFGGKVEYIGLVTMP